MDLIADILLVSGAIGAAFYCFILSRRLSKFNDLEGGMGSAVAVLSSQVDDLTKALAKAQRGATIDTEKLEDLTARAEEATKQLQLMMASMHDLPDRTERVSEPRDDQPVFSSAARRA